MTTMITRAQENGINDPMYSSYEENLTFNYLIISKSLLAVR